MDIFKTFATNESLELTGAEVPLGDAVFLIARQYNSNFNRVFGAMYKSQKAIIEGNADKDAAEAASKKIMHASMAQTILVGWRGKVEYNGEALAYSHANAEKLLSHKDFAEWVAKQSDLFQNYKMVKDEEDAKN